MHIIEGEAYDVCNQICLEILCTNEKDRKNKELMKREGGNSVKTNIT